MLIDIYEANNGLIVLGRFPDPSVFQAIEDSQASKFSLVILNCDGNSDNLHDYLKNIEALCAKGTVVYVFAKYSHRQKRPLHKLIVNAEEYTSWTFSSIISGSSFGEVACFYLGYKETDKDTNKFTGKKRTLRTFSNAGRWLDPAKIFDSLYRKHGMEKILELIISSQTKKGDWIFDPMSKMGVVASVASKLDRKFVCIEENCEDFVFAIESIKNT